MEVLLLLLLREKCFNYDFIQVEMEQFAQTGKKHIMRLKKVE